MVGPDGDLDVKRFAALPSAAGGMTRLACAQAKAAGVDVGPLLQKAGITQQQIDDQSARINVRDQIRFVNLAANALQDDFLGFHIAQLSDLRELGLLYYVAASSETLSQALQQAARYASIVNEGVSLKYVNDNEIGMIFRYVGVSRHLDRHQMEFIATILVRICRHLTGQHVVPTRTRFTHHRNTVSPDVLEFFGRDTEFDAPADDLTFAAPIRLLSVVNSDPYLNRLLIKYCEEALSRQPANLGSFRSAVENAIVPLLPHGRAQAAEIARRLGASQRTLARRLLAEGVTFSEVLESLKLHLAQRYLADLSLSISQIAWLLGYREVSAFTHAFKRWTGRAPRDVRSELSTS
jgi:AraC-like DNA-binding protein